MRSLSKRELILIGLALIAGLGYLFLRGGGLGGGAGSEATQVLSFDADAPVVRMDRLARLAEDFDAAGRDLFKYGPPPNQPRREVRKPPPKKTPPPRREPPRVEPQAPRKPPPPRAPTPTFEYVGYLGPKDDRIAVLSQGDEMQLARIGDVVEEQFRLLEFKYEIIVIGYTDERFREQSMELNVKQ